MQATLTLFSRPGRKNTNATLEAARRRADELGLKTVVVASSTGWTGLKAAKVFSGYEIIAVTLQAGRWKVYVPPDPKLVKKLHSSGVRVLTCTHAFTGNVGNALSDELGHSTGLQVIANTYYTFGQGMKVAVEIVVMAADAGLLNMKKEVLAVAGTGEGADTAIVVMPAYSTDFFDLKVREVIAMPR